MSEATARRLDATDMLAANGLSGSNPQASVSAIALHLSWEYVPLDDAGLCELPDGLHGSPMDYFWQLAVSAEMADGSVVELAASGAPLVGASGGSAGGGSGGADGRIAFDVRRDLTFPQLVDPVEIVSVTVGEAVLPVEDAG